MNSRRLRVEVQLGAGTNFVKMLLIIHRSANDLARIRHGAEQLQACQRQRWRLRRDGANARHHLVQIRNEDVMDRQWIAKTGQNLECRSHVAHAGTLYQAKPALSKSTQAHNGGDNTGERAENQESGGCGGEKLSYHFNRLQPAVLAFHH